MILVITRDIRREQQSLYIAAKTENRYEYSWKSIWPYILRALKKFYVYGSRCLSYKIIEVYLTKES